MTVCAKFAPVLLACVLAGALPFAAWADEQSEGSGQGVSASSGKAASAQVLTTQAAPSVGAVAQPVSAGLYTIGSAVNTGRVFDVPSASTASAVQLQVFDDNATPAQRWRLAKVSGGFYTITNVNSGKVLDARGGSTKSGTAVQQFAPNNTIAQKWRIVKESGGFYSIRPASNNKVAVELSDASAPNCTKLQLRTYDGSKKQLFKLNQISNKLANGYYVLMNKNSGKALDISSGSVDNSANAQQYTANGTLAQTYKVEFDSKTGYYSLLNVGSCKMLDVAYGSTENGANVQQYDSNGTRAQRWDVQKASDGSYTFRSAASGRALEVGWGSRDNGANVRLWDSNGTPAQKWSAKAVTDWLPEGTYFIHSAKAYGNVWDVSGGSVDSGANIHTYSLNGTNAQRFYVRKVGSGSYTIQNAYSGKYVDALAAARYENVSQSVVSETWTPVATPAGIVFYMKANTKYVVDMAGGRTASGTNVHIWNYNGTIAQKWILRPTEMLQNGTYTIASAANQKVLFDIVNGSLSNGAELQVYAGNGTLAQRFRVEHSGGDAYRISNAGSGKSLQASGSNVVQQTRSSAASQLWNLVLNKNGSISFAPVGDKAKRMALNGAAAAGTRVVLSASNGKTSQGWVLRSAAAGGVSYDNLSITIDQMAAIEGISSYYLNPSNVNKYQFLDLRTYSGASGDDLDRALQSIAPWIGPGNPLYKSGKYFAEAAKTYNLNEVFLLIHAGQETGWGEYAMYGGYYNFFGVDGGAGTASAAAGNAAQRGWTTVERGILGGAQYIADEWVYRSNYPQHSPYALRYDYNYVDKTRAYSHHHYTTSNEWLTITADHLKQAYGYLGKESSAAFVYPRYA